VLDFLATTDVGRASGPPVASGGEDAASEASEWEPREQAERAWERIKGGGGEAGKGLVRWRWFLFLSFFNFLYFLCFYF